MDELQVENGHFTRIVNPLIENLLKVPFKGCELAVAMLIIRKTYGYQKKEDEISLTQFQKELERSRQTVVFALKNLELLNIVVKTGRPYKTNTYKINKYFSTWLLVKTGRLVKRTGGLVKTGRPEVVQTGRHTKERKKEDTKETGGGETPQEVSTLIRSFEAINPACSGYYGNITQRRACENLIKTYTLEKVKRVIENTLPKTNLLEFFPNITTPLQLWEKWSALENKVKSKVINKPKVIFS